MKKIAVTGGIACGKSTVCQFFRDLGATTLNADQIVHELLAKDPNVISKVVKLLGSDILTEGNLNRKIIAKKVFGHPETLKSLEKILHPAVGAEIEKEFEKNRNKNQNRLFVVEIPLLFEAQQESFYEVIIVVNADKNTCLNRFKKSTGLNVKNFEERMMRQKPLEEKMKKATFIINNDGNLNKLRQQVEKIYKSLI